MSDIKSLLQPLYVIAFSVHAIIFHRTKLEFFWVKNKNRKKQQTGASDSAA